MNDKDGSITEGLGEEVTVFEKSGEGEERMRGDRLVAMANSRQKESLANGKSGGRSLISNRINERWIRIDCHLTLDTDR